MMLRLSHVIALLPGAVALSTSHVEPAAKRVAIIGMHFECYIEYPYDTNLIQAPAPAAPLQPTTSPNMPRPRRYQPTSPSSSAHPTSVAAPRLSTPGPNPPFPSS